jgi:hypothetical protein
MQIAARLAVNVPASDDRRARRQVLDAPSTMSLVGYHGHDVVVRDLSELGFKAQTDQRIKRGAIVRLRLPGLGVVLGRIIWSRMGHVGGEFVNPISASRLQMVLGIRRTLA